MFLPVYIINLSHREKRLLNTIKELRKVGLSDTIIRKEACDSRKAKSLSHEYITFEAYNNIETKLKSLKILPTWSSVGCAISHKECWENLNNSNFEYALICEDDLLVNDKIKFLYTLNTAKNMIEKKDIPLFISFDSKCSFKYEIRENIYEIYDIFTGTGCYIINKTAANLLLRIFPIKYQIDIQIGISIRKLKIVNQMETNFRCVVSENSGVKQNKKLKSDVQYYFLTSLDVFNLFNIPLEIAEKIYYYLPNMDDFKSNEYDNLGYNSDYYDYNHSYNPIKEID